MSEGDRCEPGNTMDEAPRSDANSNDPPYFDYGPTFNALYGAASAVAGAVAGRSRGRTAPQSRADVQKNEQSSSEPTHGRPLAPVRRVAPSGGVAMVLLRLDVNSHQSRLAVNQPLGFQVKFLRTG